jgi:hypothetical protein
MTDFESLQRSNLIRDGGIQSIAIDRTQSNRRHIFCNLSYTLLEIFAQKQSFWSMPGQNRPDKFTRYDLVT